MRKLDTSAISITNALPIKSGTLDHLQLSYQEVLTAIANNMIGARTDANNYFIMYGCINTGSGLNYVISSGAIYYNGEVFLVDATTFTAAAGQVAVGNFATTYNTTNADPVTFTDSVSRNVHQVRKITFSAGASGSGIIDFTALKQTQITLANQVVANLPASYVVRFDQDYAIFFSSATVSTTISFDFTNCVPGAVVRLKWTFGAGLTLAINGATGQTVIKDSGNLAAAASANNLLYMCYMGKNDLGNFEVSYILKQY